MSYNGIGLSSVRGTATSGHVQANQGHVSASRLRRKRENNRQTSDHKRFNPVSASARERGNEELQQHDQKRKLENNLLILREDLEESGKFTETEIDARVNSERERQLAKRRAVEDSDAARKARHNSEQAMRPEAGKEGTENGATSSKNYNNHRRGLDLWQNHQILKPWDQHRGGREKNNHINAVRKEHENDRLRDAFGIRKDRHVEGQAFDQDLQKEKKRERQLKLEEEHKAKEKADRKRLQDVAKLEKKAYKGQKKMGGTSKATRRRRGGSSSSSSDSSRSYSSRSYSSSSSESSFSSSEDRGSKRRRRRVRSYSSSSSSGSSSADSRAPTRNRKDKKEENDRKHHQRSESPHSKRWNKDDNQKPFEFIDSKECKEDINGLSPKHSRSSSYDSSSRQSHRSSSRSRSRHRNDGRLTKLNKHDSNEEKSGTSRHTPTERGDPPRRIRDATKTESGNENAKKPGRTRSPSSDSSSIHRSHRSQKHARRPNSQRIESHMVKSDNNEYKTREERVQNLVLSPSTSTRKDDFLTDRKASRKRKEKLNKRKRVRSTSSESGTSQSSNRSRSPRRSPNHKKKLASVTEVRRERSVSVDSFGRSRPGNLNRGRSESTGSSSSSSTGSSRRRSF